MAAPHPSDVTPAPRTARGAAAARSAITAPIRWTLWVLSSALAAGTIVALAHIGAGGAETQLPPVVQVGRQAAANTVTTIPVTSPTTPTTTSPSTTSTTIAPTTTTTIGRTLVIRPQPTITSGDDKSGDAPDASSGTTTTSQPTTSTDN